MKVVAIRALATPVELARRGFAWTVWKAATPGANLSLPFVSIIKRIWRVAINHYLASFQSIEN